MERDRRRVGEVFVCSFHSLFVSLLGAATGVLIAYGLLSPFLPTLLGQFVPNAFSRVTTTVHIDVAPDSTVLAFCFAVTLLTMIAFGLWPAYRTSRIDLQAAIKAVV